MDTSQQDHIFEFWTSPPQLGLENNKSRIWVQREDFYCNGTLPTGKGSKAFKTSQPYLLIGFDTEFKTPDITLKQSEIRSGQGVGKTSILSYQYYAKHSDGQTWNGICLPDEGQRLKLTQFMAFVLGEGARQHSITNIPLKIFLVGHFTRADIPAFADFMEMTNYMSSIRSTFVSDMAGINVKLPVPSGAPVALSVMLRDTVLLTPQAERSLKALGKLVGVEKVELANDRATRQAMIENMDKVLVENWPLFREYAITDAEICVKYIEQVIAEYQAVIGKFSAPLTLTSIGVDLVLKTWRDTMGINPNVVLGEEIIEEKIFNKRRGYFEKIKRTVPMMCVYREIAAVTECYHGGRNEQYWFGPGFEDDWIDLDLSSAYPTAMSLIGLPDWHSIRDSKNLDDYTATTMGYVEVEFKFPDNTRYPTLPVRTSNGLIFPLSGISHCAAPELFTARRLGAELKILHGVIVDHDRDVPIFKTFIADCINKRNKAGKNTLKGLFWKEISNSTYGKTAQGLHPKRVYDLSARDMVELAPSKITNAFFAAFTTSFVRAVLGEILNTIPTDKIVFSCTTDGFLTNVRKSDIPTLLKGPLAQIYAEQRELLVGDSTVLEIKHQIRQPMGWRTRGQATLKPGTDPAIKQLVLAKGGIYTRPEYEEVGDQNPVIVAKFLNRSPTDVIEVEGLTGIKELVEHESDFMGKVFTKRLNMEYDWKRVPDGVSMSIEHQHVAFSTKPWPNVHQFIKMRNLWDEYTDASPLCIKSLEDYDRLAEFIEPRSYQDSELGKYLRKENGDVHRLVQMLCRAFKHSSAGLERTGLTANAFASILQEHGLPCQVSDVQNAKKPSFIAHSVPRTARVQRMIAELKASFPKLRGDELLMKEDNHQMISLLDRKSCRFTQLVR
jgi:DNA polymerase type B, organellar and viral